MKAIKYKRCKGCNVMKLPTVLVGGRCHSCRPKKAPQPAPEQSSFAMEVPVGCEHARPSQPVCESCRSLVRPGGER